MNKLPLHSAEVVKGLGLRQKAALPSNSDGSHSPCYEWKGGLGITTDDTNRWNDQDISSSDDSSLSSIDDSVLDDIEMDEGGVKVLQ